MNCSEDEAFRFTTFAQWQAGAHDVTFTDSGSQVRPHRCLELVDTAPIAEGDNCGLLAAVDVCGRLNVMSSTSRAWCRFYDVGIGELGRLDGGGTSPVVDMVLGRDVIWLGTDYGLERHDAHTFGFLGLVESPSGDAIGAITSDGRDGLWLVTANNHQTPCVTLRRIDRWGRECVEPLVLTHDVPASVSVVATAEGSSVVVLLTCESGTASLLHVEVDDGCEITELPVRFAGIPVGLATDGDRGFVSLSYVPAVEGLVVLDSFDIDGLLTGREYLEVPAALGAVVDVAPGPTPTVVGSSGLAAVVECERARPATFTYITPTLTRSVAGKGWNRAELTALIPVGATIEIDWVSSDDATLAANIDEVFDAPGSSPLSRLITLQSLGPDGVDWPDDSERTIRCSGSPSSDDNPVLLPVQLDEADGQFLWMRLRIMVPVGRNVPSLKSLQILHGNDSYIDFLPAIYRDGGSGEADMRQVLAPFEVVFDQLDAAIAALPTRIDPATAPDDWTDYLLSWLGFPRLGDLDPVKRRSLLGAAPELLQGRGTVGALSTLLDILTDGRADVEDGGAVPAGWVLPALGPDCEPLDGGSVPARLGSGTVLRAQQPAPFRAGVATLGRAPLGPVCVDPGLVLSQTAGRVSITLDVSADNAATLAPIIDRLLAVFVPAHCRVSVNYTETDPATRSATLDTDLRLADDSPGSGDDDASRLSWSGHWRLGGTTRAGTWQLPDPDEAPAVLDRPGPDDQQNYLS